KGGETLSCLHGRDSWSDQKTERAVPSPILGEGQVENPAKGGGEGSTASSSLPGFHYSKATNPED
ncbi:MAG: hypothetical protein WBC98_12965, partial [Candidatus Zixiibacteriota bacterium]